jgi:hypothetical protein
MILLARNRQRLRRTCQRQKSLICGNRYAKAYKTAIFHFLHARYTKPESAFKLVDKRANNSILTFFPYAMALYFI